MDRTGYVLVGGKSARMGRDKALLPFRGATLVESVAAAVKRAAGSAVLVGSSSQYGGLGYPVTPDIYPGEGPLGGILTALQNTTKAWNLIVACDMPELSEKFLEDILDAAAARNSDILIPSSPSGRLEPLCAVYHQRSRQVLYAAFERGIRKVTAAFAGLSVVTLPVSALTPLQNVNTPEEWAGYVAK